MRSPYIGDSYRVRNVKLDGHSYGGWAMDPGFGVRPALFSEGTELQAFAVLRLLGLCALCQPLRQCSLRFCS